MTKDQVDMFGNGKSVEETQIEDAIEFLNKHGYAAIKTAEEAKEEAIRAGYRVSDPLKVNDKVINLTDLRNYFYMRLWKKYPDRVKYYSGDPRQEIRMCRLLVEAREQTGLNRRNAIQESVAIIDIIFDHEEEFNFKKSITINVLGQGAAGWITQKALLILSRELEKETEARIEKEMIEAEKDMKMDLSKQSDKLDKLLTIMEVNNG
jgi:hypothetical protein